MTVTAVVVTFSSQPRDDESKMNEYQRLSHTRWDCKYHVVFIPKQRKKLLFGKLRKHIGEVVARSGRIREGKCDSGKSFDAGYIHMCISILLKYSVSHVVGFIKGKSAIAIARQLDRGRNFTEENFWTLGYFVLTTRLDEERIREYMRD